MNLSFRPAASPADRRFIVSTWSSSYKKCHSAGLIRAERWAAVMHPEFEAFLDREGAKTLLACEREDPAYCYGWIAGDTTESTPVVFYVYVLQPYRRTGIARSLFSAFGVDPKKYFVYVCAPPIARTLWPQARFNPNEVRYPKESRRRPL